MDGVQRSKRSAALKATTLIQTSIMDFVEVKVEQPDSDASASISEESESGNDTDDEEVEQAPDPVIKIENDSAPQTNSNFCVCIKCGQYKHHKSDGVCIICYYKVNIMSIENNCKCAECGQEKLEYAGGKCIVCFYGVTQQMASEQSSSERKSCTKCNATVKTLHVNRLCLNCYKNLTIEEKEEIRRKRHLCQSCEKRKRALGMCGVCYRRANRDPLANHRNCANCGEFKKHSGKGMCKECFYLKVKKIRQRKKRIGVCVTCKETKRIQWKGNCCNCRHKYMKEHAELKECTDCKKVKPAYQKSLCVACYTRQRYHSKEWRAKKKQKCRVCDEVKFCPARGLCWACYQKIFQLPKRRAQKLKKKAQERRSVAVKVELSSGSEDDFERPMDVSSGEEDFFIKYEVKSESDD